MLRQHRDLEAEVRTVVPGPVRIVVLDLILLELERLARMGSASVRTWANAAIDLIAKRSYPMVEHRPGPTEVDVSLVQCALSETNPTAIATIDRELRKTLKTFNIPAILPKARYGLISERLLL